MRTLKHNLRLSKLADHLDDLPPERFDMDNWFNITSNPPPKHHPFFKQGPYGIQLATATERAEYVREHPCGTTACIAGWAIILFPEAAEEAVSRVGRNAMASRIAADILGLDLEERTIFYDPSGEIRSPQTAADHLRMLCDDATSCEDCDGRGRIYNNADPTSGQWVKCETCNDPRGEY